MTKEELKQEARQKALEWNGEKINGKYNRPPIANWSCYEKGYLAGAEPREKRIAELTEQNTSLLTSVENLNKSVQELEAEVKEWKDKADLWCKTANLKDHNIMINKELEKENAELEAQIEKLIDFVLSKTECCDVCPITDTCINSEGTCPYAGILAKGEEEVTREWLVQKVAKEIKEK